MSGQDRFLHNLEHRGSLENGARALFSFALLLLVVGGAFGLLFANSTVLGDLLTANSTALACDGLRQIIGDDGATDVPPPPPPSLPPSLPPPPGLELGLGVEEEAGSGDDALLHYYICLELSTQALSFLPVLVAPAVNQVLYVVVDVLARLQRPGSFRRLTYTKATNIFLFQLVNTGLIPLLVACFSRLSQEQQRAAARGEPPPPSVLDLPYDFRLDEEWYELASGAVLLTILALALSSGAFPFGQRAGLALWRRHLASDPVTLRDATAQATGPPVQFAQRVGSTMSVVCLVLVYGPGMPLAWLFGTLYFAVAIVTQRWALLRLHRLPDLAFDDTVIKRQVKWAKYILVLHLLATYCTFRPLPCASLRELHPTVLAPLRGVGWLQPLVAQQGPWLSAAAFRAAAVADGASSAAADSGGALVNATAAAMSEAAPSEDPISVGALVTLTVLVLGLAGILAVCVCSSAVKLCNSGRRRLQQLEAETLFVRAGKSAQELAGMQGVYQRKLELATELGELEGLPPLSAALEGAEHPALRRMPKTGAFVHLNEITWRRSLLERVCCRPSGVLWSEWLDAACAGAHTVGAKSYKPLDHPHYREACKVIAAARRTSMNREQPGQVPDELQTGAVSSPVVPGNRRNSLSAAI